MRAGRSSRAGFSGRFHGPIFAGRSSRGGFKGRSLQAGLHGARCSEGKEVNGRRDCGQGGPLRAAPCFGLTFRIVPYIGFFLFRAAPHFGPSPDPGRWFRAIPIGFVCPCPGRTKACRRTWAALVRNAGGCLSGADAESGRPVRAASLLGGKIFHVLHALEQG